MNQKILSSILLFANTTSVVLATDYNNKAVSEENKKRDQENIVFDTQLDEVVVTATHTPKALKDVPVVTRLIPLADLKKVDATNVQDLLTQELPGLEFGFAMSQETSLNMSGFGGNAVLFITKCENAFNA
jgi:outer membrane receptor for ferrienterochelin and colicins